MGRVSIVPRDSVEIARERGKSITSMPVERRRASIGCTWSFGPEASLGAELAAILKRGRGQIRISSFERGGTSNDRARSKAPPCNETMKL
jgi:hypothetical protein